MKYLVYSRDPFDYRTELAMFRSLADAKEYAFALARKHGTFFDYFITWDQTEDMSETKTIAVKMPYNAEKKLEVVE